MENWQNLFLAKLPRILTDADLLQLFTEHDHHPVSAKVMLDAVSGKSKGFGFVLFDTEEQGRAAYEALNKMHVTVRGHNFALCISPSKHNGKAATEESNTLYIRNIPDTLKREEVERFLSKFGTLMHFLMRPDHYGNPVWVVSAVYESIDGARNALAKLHGNRTYFSGVPPIMAKFRDTTEVKLERRRRRQVTRGGTPPVSQSPSSQSTSEMANTSRTSIYSRVAFPASGPEAHSGLTPVSSWDNCIASVPASQSSGTFTHVSSGVSTSSPRYVVTNAPALATTIQIGEARQPMFLSVADGTFGPGCGPSNNTSTPDVRHMCGTSRCAVLQSSLATASGYCGSAVVLNGAPPYVLLDDRVFHQSVFSSVTSPNPSSPVQYVPNNDFKTVLHTLCRSPGVGAEQCAVPRVFLTTAQGT